MSNLPDKNATINEGIRKDVTQEQKHVYSLHVFFFKMKWKTMKHYC